MSLHFQVEDHLDMSDSSSARSSNSASSTTSSMSSLPTPTTDPTCIVGMACRVPGASKPSQLWDNIAKQVDLQSKMPADRFNVDAWYHPDGTHKGTTNAKYGYFLDQDLGMFDASFFKISGREAEAMDPQQRLLLEVVYEALENAGITLDEVRGTQTSVFCGTFTNDYNASTTKDLTYYPKYTVTGTGNSILANRISYFYDLHGPSATIDTACSSSLVCFHMGHNSLHNGEADLAIVVGSALHFDPKIFVEMTDLGMLSTDGRCRHGDAMGSGYVRGEGITAVVLKRKQHADLAGNNVRAVVRGTGVNHDGSKQGITLPSDKAQADLIQRVYQSAGLNPADTQYVECHGTGTKAGDPRELRALGSVFAPGRDEPLWVGSVKTNIGHLEGASGLAGVIKATMALENHKIPPNMHFSSPNPEIDFKTWNVQIPTQMVDWKCETVRRVSINSFGYGGTNAHVILEECRSKSTPYPLEPLPPRVSAMDTGRPYLMPITSHSEPAGKVMSAKILSYLNEHPQVQLADLVTSLSNKRTMHRFRSFAVGNNIDSMARSLENPLPIANWTSGRDTIPRLGFVFTGQGAQWFAMGRQLIEQSPLFRQTLEKCDEILSKLSQKPTWSVVEELLRSKETTKLAQTTYSQPICTAIQLAIVDLISQWGIKPSAVVGHSSGEMAAAYASGALSFENAIVAAYYRGLHMGNAAVNKDAAKGSMMAIGLTERETILALKEYSGKLAIAAMNSPSSFTVSGDEDAIVDLQAKLTEKKVFARRLQVAQAFHSHHMIPLAPAYRKALEEHPGFKAEQPSVLMMSSVTARKVKPDHMGPSYWTDNMTGTVRFSDALTGIVLDEEDQQNLDLLVEIGPHPALKGPSKQVLDSLKLQLPYVASLDRSLPAFESLLNLAGQLFSQGYPVDLSSVNSTIYIDSLGVATTHNSGEMLDDLPTYGWHHSRYWADTRVIQDLKLRKHNHEILGAKVPGSLDQRPLFRNFLRVSEIPWLVDHKINGKVIFPAAGYVNMAIEAAVRLGETEQDVKQINIKDVSVKSALVVSDTDIGTETIVELRPVSESAKTQSNLWTEFAIFSFDESKQCREHCTGLIGIEFGPASSIHRLEEYESSTALRNRSDRCIGRDRYYTVLDQIGLQYGHTFQLLSGSIECGNGFATSQVKWESDLFSSEDSAKSILHPALLDASIHPIFAAIESCLGTSLNEPFIPTFIRSLKVSGKLANQSTGFCARASVNTKLNGPRVALNDVRIEDESSGDLIIDIQGLELTNIGGDDSDQDSKRSLFFGIKWKELFGYSSQPNADLDVNDFAHMLDLYAHRYPNTNILHYSPDVKSTENLLSKLGGTRAERRRFAQMTVVPDSVESHTLYESLVAEYDGLIRVGEPGETKFDAIILSMPATDTALTHLKDDGYVFVDSPGVTISGLHPVYKGKTSAIWTNIHRSTYMPTSLTIITANTPHKKADAIAKQVKESVNGEVHIRSLRSVAEGGAVTGDVVNLASLDNSMLFLGDDAKSDYEAARKLLTSSSCNMVWLTQGGMRDCSNPEQALVLGLARTARSENDALRLVVFDIDEQSLGSAQNLSDNILQLLDPALQEDEIALRNETFSIPRIEADDSLNAGIPNGVNHEVSLQPLYQPDRPLALRIGRPGLLETLAFSDDLEILTEPLDDDALEIEVHASAINFRDIAASMGIIDDYRLGDECAGIVLRKGSAVSDESFKVGDRVVAWRPGQGAHRTICRNPAALCFKLGPLSFSIAAALPLILTTAHYSLIDTARLGANEYVLIHSAAGGVGQMAIQIAKMIGAKVIATVGSPAKRDLLKSVYGLKDEQILFSRDDSFVEGVLKLTNGKGVDVVLNSLAGKLLHASWACLAPFGRFIEIGKRDIHQNSKIDMDPFRKSVTFASVDLITMFETNKDLGARVFQESCRLVHEGKIQPPESIVEIPYEQAEKGFRLLQMGKVTGKIVLVPGKNDKVMVQPKRLVAGKIFDADKAYLLVGGLGGLGRSLSEWLYRKGARHIAFLSRSGDKNRDAKETVAWLQERGVKVSVYRGDVTDFSITKSCIDSIGSRLAGIFHAAMVLQDAPLNKMTFVQWQNCLLPKVKGAYNLHMASLNTSLDFFICFSSVSTILGSKGQANYSAANSYLDALCQSRRATGLPATTMNVGMITGIGAVSENAALHAIMDRIGYDGVNPEELFAQIEVAVTHDPLAGPTALGFEGHQTITGVNLRKDDYFWTGKPLFRNLYSNHNFLNASSSSSKQNLTAQLQSAKDNDGRVEVLTDAFIKKIAAILSVEEASILPSRGLADYGLDSIVAVEIRKWFFKSAGVELAVFDVLGSKSIQALITKAVGLIVLDGPKSGATEVATGQKLGKDDVEGNATTNGDVTKTIQATTLQDVPMSTFQKRLWFVHNMAEDGSFLNLPIIFRLNGVPDARIVERSLSELRVRNTILRTAYFEGDEYAQQEVTDDISVNLPVLDLTSHSSSEDQLQRYVDDMQNETLSIEDGEVMRAALIKLPAGQAALVLIIHHIAIDRGSSESFLEQFTQLYDGIKLEMDLSLIPSPKVTYGDFSAWHNEQLKSNTMQPHIDFWKATFEKESGPSKVLPFAKTERPVENDFKRQIHRGVLKQTTHSRMKRISARMGITPAQFLIAAFRAFLYRYTEEDDITIHMIDGNRPHPAVVDTLGFFVNVIPIRCATDNEGSFEEMLNQVSSLVLASLEHSAIPFDTIVDAVGAERSSSYFPLGQVIVNYQMHGKMPAFSTTDFTIEDVRGEDIPTACELNLEALEDPALGLKLRLESSSTLYESANMERFLENFLVFLTSATVDHHQPISEINMTGEKELLHLKRHLFNMDTKTPTWANHSVVSKFLEVAEQYPEHTAIETSEGDQITYKSLVASSKAIASSIINAGAKPENKVGVLSRPGIAAISSMLACLMARCGYVSLDPDFAAERLRFMVTDSGATIVLTTDDLHELANDICSDTTQVQVMSIERAASAETAAKFENSQGTDPFYMIYTSGSTGKPKGVVLSQSNTHQMLNTLNKDFKFSRNDRFLHHSSICFDLSVVQIFSALTCGAKVCVASAATRKDPVALASYMEQSSVTVTYFTPTQFALLIEHAKEQLQQCHEYRVAYFAGERLPVRVAKNFYDLGTPATLYNTWSPSELVVQTTIQKVDYPKEGDVSIPIGLPMDNTRHYILDTHGNALPEGLIGEIVVGGAQVGQGYLNRPEANAKSFVPDTFCSHADRQLGWTNMFRTGDKGRFLPDGRLEFHGRIAGDKQVKLRGFRIDLGEVEQRLFQEANDDKASPGIADISVIARNIDSKDNNEDETDNRQIIAFVVTKSHVDDTAQQYFAASLNEKASKHLNSYMLPNAYQFIDSLPVTIGGKVDRQRLLKSELSLTFPIKPTNTETASTTTDVSSMTADNEVVSNVTKAFRDVLKISPEVLVEPTSSFFQLGGQSILMLRLQNKLKRQYKKTLPLNSMFKTPTPVGIASLLKTSADSKKNGSASMDSTSVNWSVETTLKTGSRWSVSTPAQRLPRSEYSDVLLTGADSFIGVHMLATLLMANPKMIVYVLGSQKEIKEDLIQSSFHHYMLDKFSGIGLGEIRARVRCVPGTLEFPKFGLSNSQFNLLGSSLHAIYHFGGSVSLLKSYGDLRDLNVSPVRDIIELASLGQYRTEIFHLSTWSVPHLQSWPSSKILSGVRNETVRGEVSADYFQPEPSDRYGYFKSRWVAERLMNEAAARGFPVTIIRSSAVTAHSTTQVPEPKEDFIRRMIVGMVEAGAIPQMPTSDAEFAVDFVPVDHLTTSIHALTLRAEMKVADPNQPAEATIHHIGNPQPLPLSKLPAMLGQTNSDTVSLQGKATLLPLDQWLKAVTSTDKSPEAELRWAVLKDYFSIGHNMFALDRTNTAAALKVLEVEDCAAINDEYLMGIIRRDRISRDSGIEN